MSNIVIACGDSNDADFQYQISRNMTDHEISELVRLWNLAKNIIEKKCSESSYRDDRLVTQWEHGDDSHDLHEHMTEEEFEHLINHIPTDNEYGVSLESLEVIHYMDSDREYHKGDSSPFNRPKFKKIDTKKVDGIIVYSIDRLTRQHPTKVMNMLNYLKTSGILGVFLS